MFYSLPIRTCVIICQANKIGLKNSILLLLSVRQYNKYLCIISVQYLQIKITKSRATASCRPRHSDDYCVCSCICRGIACLFCIRASFTKSTSSQQGEG